LGYTAGNFTTGNNNIDIGNRGVAAESNTIRIDTEGTQTATYIARSSQSCQYSMPPQDNRQILNNRFCAFTGVLNDQICRRYRVSKIGPSGKWICR
jgi:hypothetical protein